MATKLQEAARTINELVKREEDTRRQLCIAIAGAMDLVKRESNLSFAEWASQNLRKPDGSKWGMWTLYTYAKYGRKPEKLEQSRRAIAEHGRIARRAVHATPVPAGRRPQQQIDVEKQVSWLMSAWSNASPPARKRFLKLIRQEEAAA
jgi:hypothetical protein